MKSAAAKQSMAPNTRYHRRNESLLVGANLSRRSAAQISAARWGATTIKTPSAILTALTNRFIASKGLIHMLTHLKPLFGRGKDILVACNPHI
jgi:hypothetical protein